MICLYSFFQLDWTLSIIHLTMSPLLTWAFVILSVVSVDARSFNCKNPGDVCKNNGECSFFGKCTCTPGFQGYNCGLDSALITNSTVCTVECQNKGICYSTNKCYCTEDFIGERCEQPVDSTVCKPRTMVLYSYRPLGFKGEMFLSNSMQNCKLKEVITDVPGYKKYELELHHKSTSICQLQKTNRDTTKEIVYSADMATSYEKNKFGLLDSVTRMECAYPQMEVGTIADISQQRAVPMEILNDNYEPVIQIDAQNGVILQFQPLNLTDIDAVIVTHLEAYIFDSAHKVTSVVLLKDECPVRETEKRYQPNISIDSKQYAGLWYGTANFKAFTIFESDPMPLKFTYRVRFCLNKCIQASCGTVIPPTLRKPHFTSLGLQLDVVP